jgi:hypothetical protein
MAMQLHFLPPNIPQQSQREKELNDAIRKAHAARIGYQKRKQKLKRPNLVFRVNGAQNIRQLEYID